MPTSTVRNSREPVVLRIARIVTTAHAGNHRYSITKNELTFPLQGAHRNVGARVPQTRPM